MGFEILYHIIVCPLFCILIHILFHKKSHTNHELTDEEIHFIKDMVKTGKKSAHRPLTDVRPDLLRK